MHVLTVKLSDGTERSGWLAEWHPVEGYLVMGDNADGKHHRIDLSKTISIDSDGNDLLEKAEFEGWSKEGNLKIL